MPDRNWKQRLQDRFLSRITKILTKPRGNYALRVPNDLDLLRRTLRKGDILLVEGDQRISQVICYLTQSCWSHCALYIGDGLQRHAPREVDLHCKDFGDDVDHLLIEAVEGVGVTCTPISKYKDYNLRLCRPIGLSKQDTEEVIRYAISRLGYRYNRRQILDLARYFFPVTIIPPQLRLAVMYLSSTTKDAVICSTMIAEGLAAVGYPILPQWTELPAPDGGSWRRVLPRRWRQHTARFRRHDPSLITPRDFDLSPYFEIVKFHHFADASFDYHQIIWENEREAG